MSPTLESILPRRLWRTVGVGALVVVGLVICAEALGEWRQGRRLQAESRRADDASSREAKAKTQTAAAKAVAAERTRERDALQHRLDSLPRDPGPRPVEPNAAMPVVVEGLRGLGLAPWVLGDDLGLTLPDGRTVINWGREAQRVGPLAARLETSIALARAQEGVTDALLQQVAGLTTALGAADERSEAERRRADLAPKDRRWSAGALAGVDWTGTPRVGAYMSRSWGPLQAQVVVLGGQMALGGGMRW